MPAGKEQSKYKLTGTMLIIIVSTPVIIIIRNMTLLRLTLSIRKPHAIATKIAPNRDIPSIVLA